MSLHFAYEKNKEDQHFRILLPVLKNISNFFIQSFKPLACLSNLAGQFVSDLVYISEDRFPCDERAYFIFTGVQKKRKRGTYRALGPKELYKVCHHLVKEHGNIFSSAPLFSLHR